MVRHLKVLAISMVFTTVAMGFAYALPSALRGAASQVSEELQMVEEEESAEEVASEEAEGETEVEPGDEGSDGEGSEGSEGGEETSTDENHGAVVFVAAHCPVTGRAHGELVREVAGDKEMNVAEAEEACEEAVSAQEDQVKPGKHAKPGEHAKPEKPAKPAKPVRPAKPEKPADPKPAKPEKPATAAGSDKPDKPKKSH